LTIALELPFRLNRNENSRFSLSRIFLTMPKLKIALGFAATFTAGVVLATTAQAVTWV
jgi:hypothetical protein